jgi:hypothetical protein
LPFEAAIVLRAIGFVSAITDREAATGARIWHAAGSETQKPLLSCVNTCGPGWDDAIRDSYTEGMQSIVDVVATHLSPHDPSAARTKALGLFTLLVATVQLARAISDRQLSDDILESGIRNAQILLDCGKVDGRC